MATRGVEKTDDQKNQSDMDNAMKSLYADLGIDPNQKTVEGEMRADGWVQEKQPGIYRKAFTLVKGESQVEKVVIAQPLSKEVLFEIGNKDFGFSIGGRDPEDVVLKLDDEVKKTLAMENAHLGVETVRGSNEPTKAAHELTFDEFSAVAKVQKIGNQFEVLYGKESLGISDSATPADALKNAYRTETRYHNITTGFLTPEDNLKMRVQSIERTAIEPGIELVYQKNRMYQVTSVDHRAWGTITTGRDLESNRFVSATYSSQDNIKILASEQSLSAAARNNPLAVRPDLVVPMDNKAAPAYNEPRVTGRLMGVATDGENGEKLPWLLVKRMDKTLAVGVKVADLNQLPPDIRIGDAIRVQQHVQRGAEIGARIESLEKRHQIDKSNGVER